MKFEYVTTYDPTVEQYRQFLLGELRRMEESAQKRLEETSAGQIAMIDIEAVRRDFPRKGQP